jgi:hypothetical protein
MEPSLKSHAQVQELARLHDRTLGAGDFPPGRLVLIRHADGTQLLFRYAFLLKHEDWVVVFTEHHSFHCYPTENPEEFVQYDERPEIGAS